MEENDKMYKFYSYVFNDQYSMIVTILIIMWKADIQYKNKIYRLVPEQIKTRTKKRTFMDEYGRKDYEEEGTSLNI